MLANPAPASSMASLQDGLALLARGEGDDAGIGRSSSQLSGDRGPTASGHPDVHECHIGLVAFGELDRLASVLGHPNPVEGGLPPDLGRFGCAPPEGRAVPDALPDRPRPSSWRPAARAPPGLGTSESGSRFPSNDRMELRSRWSLPRPQRFHPHALHNVNEIGSPWGFMVTVSSSCELQVGQRAELFLFMKTRINPDSHAWGSAPPDSPI